MLTKLFFLLLLLTMNKWWLIDADSKVLGRLATKIASLLMGKDSASYVPWKNDGDFVVCINADKIKVTGNKEQDKIYTRYSGYHSGLKKISLERMRKEHPERILYHAVSGMLPKNRLRAKRLKKFKVHAGPTHPHTAQNPVKYDMF